MQKSERVKAHFEEEAHEFDELILKLIPHYEEMINALISSIPFNHDDSIKVLDLGCGTGTITKNLKEKFPNARVKCLDLARNMIEMAKIKLQEYDNINYVIGDFYRLDISEKYDVIVSSLALHHLVTDEDKKDFYKKIYAALNPGGIFLNADVVLGSNDNLQILYINKWKEFMSLSVSAKEIEEKWIPAAEAEDHPAKLVDQLKWLVEIGFRDVDVIWKYYGVAVYGGFKIN
ncbi:MAG: class I SAM-dependent methyltransferase [Methanobacterium sp.]|uniref:class I SAM-dependent methyltransferase n=1 Tax=Methanobacterium sp. TaxID=2164 RepID=UPI003D65E3EF|nr:class I SAM-dependent methyltransferase [Methanobacterium sp.]